ncbi:ATP-binding protein [Microbispora sp. ATCC PTA-5024]|uniref:ATP-binding protein n=1 Tax=Microbispora sp. ATCC PTA-5024 TaxID=316330 RepID=UPI000A01E034|nr:ATP-binding protein [Microbispora sp. ATCC PTA-5024]
MTDDRQMDTPPGTAEASDGGGGPMDAGGPAPILDQPFDRDSLYALRATLEAHATHAGLPHGRATDLVLIVHELATNAVFHSSGTGRVRIWRSAGSLRCEVSDAGGPAPAGRDAAAWPVRHGHGLWLARYLTDRFTIASGTDGTVATADFVLPAPDHPSAGTLDRRDSYAVLALEGALDERAAAEIARVVRGLVSDTSAPRLVVDLSGVAFWDSTGITALISAQQRLDQTPGGMMALSGLTPKLAHRLDGLSPTPFTVADTRAQAAGRFPARPDAD